MVEQFVLLDLELCDLYLHSGQVTTQTFRTAVSFTMFPFGKRSFGHQRPDSGVFCFVCDLIELFLPDTQFVSQGA